MSGTEQRQESRQDGESGRARVRRCLIEPLNDLGMKRKRGVTEAVHAADMTRIADRLSYMTEPGLRGLAEYVIRLAHGPCKDFWPAPVAVIRAGYDMERPPPLESDYALSIVRSEMGRAAFEAGYAVELFQIARRIGPPPNRYILSKLRAEAEDNRRRVELIRERAAKGAARPEDLAWLDAYQNDRATCEAIRNEQTRATV